MKKMFLSLGIAVAALMVVSCDKSDDVEALGFDTLKSASTVQGDGTHIFTTTATDLTPKELDGLLLMREEEKMAGDVYAFFFSMYELPVFERIVASENRHAEAVLALLNHFEIADPTLTGVGVFSNPNLQALYDQFVSQGSTVEAALAIGAYIEELDIADLKKLLDETDNADLELVYGNLLKGSENHLRAFVNTLSSLGETYHNQVLADEVFAEILAVSNGNKGAGKMGQGRKNGNQAQNRAQNQQDVDGDGICDATGEPVTVNSNTQSRKGKRSGK
jgi:hypothetical protein